MVFDQTEISLARSRLFDLRYHRLSPAALFGDYNYFFQNQIDLNKDENNNNANKKKSTKKSQEEEEESDQEEEEEQMFVTPGGIHIPLRNVNRRTTESSSSPTTETNQNKKKNKKNEPNQNNINNEDDDEISLTNNNNQKQTYVPEYLKTLVNNAHVSNRCGTHGGCVNSIEFNSSATMLLTGSDDTCVGLFSTVDSSWRPLGMFTTAHTRNIFNAIFVPHSNDTHIASCGLDGATVLTILGENGVDVRSSQVVAESDFMSSSLVSSPFDSNILYVSRGAGGVSCVDLRRGRSVATFSPTNSISPRSVNHLAVHPLHPYVLALGSDSANVYFSDIRMIPGGSTAANSSALSSHTSGGNMIGGMSFLAICNRNASNSVEGIGGINFSERGDRIVVSYKGGEVVGYDWTSTLPASNRRKLSSQTSNDGLGLQYEFNTCKYATVTEVPAKVYVGRKNNVTMFKEPIYFNDDTIVATGGDCGNVFFWETESCKLLGKVRGDSDVVNGVLSHKSISSIVCCGIDSSAKVISFDKLHSAKFVEKQKEFKQNFSGVLESSSFSSPSDENAAAEREEPEEEAEEEEEEEQGQSGFRIRNELFRQLFGAAGANIPSRFSRNITNDGDADDEDEDEGGGDVDFDDSELWGQLANENDDDFLTEADEYEEANNMQLRELIQATIIVLKQQIQTRGTIEELTRFFRLRANSLKTLMEEVSKIDSPSFENMEVEFDEEEIEEEDDDDDEIQETNENIPPPSAQTTTTTTTSSTSTSTSTSTSNNLTELQQQLQNQKQQKEKEEAEAEEKSKKEEKEKELVPEISITTASAGSKTQNIVLEEEKQEYENQNQNQQQQKTSKKSKSKKEEAIQKQEDDDAEKELAAFTASSKSAEKRSENPAAKKDVFATTAAAAATTTTKKSDSDQDNADANKVCDHDDDEDEEEEETVGDILLRQQQDEDEEDDDDSSIFSESVSDDELMSLLLEVVEHGDDLLRSVLDRCRRAQLLAEDIVLPRVHTDPTHEDVRHPLLELAEAMCDVVYIALLDKNRLHYLSAGMKQEYLVLWLKILNSRAIICAARADLDDAMSLAMEALSIDESNIEALGVAVGVARKRSQEQDQPESDSLLHQLEDFGRGASRCRTATTQTRRAAARLMNIVRELRGLTPGGGQGGGGLPPGLPPGCLSQ